MRTHRIPARPHVQGIRAPLDLSFDAHDLTDGAGLLLVRRLWDQLGLGARIDDAVDDSRSDYRASLHIEVWVALLLYGGSVMTDLARVATRGIRRLFGWARVPDATTFGRWLRRGGEAMLTVLDALLWDLVQARWAAVGRPTALLLILDSTVVQRYGRKQAGAEVGYNPMKRGRPSHHPLLAVTDTGDLLGIRWRGGKAHTADGAIPWLEQLVARLRAAGIQELTVRLDKGFFSQAMVAALDALGVAYVLKVPNHAWVRRHLSAYRASEKDPTLWTATGELYGARLCSVEQRVVVPAAAACDAAQAALALETEERETVAHVLTNIAGIHALTAWRRYNEGAVVEQRIKECYQLGFGGTAIDDRDGNAILALLGGLAYQLLHVLRTTALAGAWRRAQPATLRAWLFRMPASCTTHARQLTVHGLADEPLSELFGRALKKLERLTFLRPRSAFA